VRRFFYIRWVCKRSIFTGIHLALKNKRVDKARDILRHGAVSAPSLEAREAI